MKHVKIPMLLMLFFVHFGYSAPANTYAPANTFGPLKADTSAYQADIQKVNAIYGEAFIKGDSALFMSCYAEDASIMPPNAPVMSGIRGQQAFFRFAYKSGVRNIKFTTLGFFGYQGEYVTEQGSYEMFAANDMSIGVGKYLVVWKKTQDGWKMYRDMFSSNAPATR